MQLLLANQPDQFVNSLIQATVEAIIASGVLLAAFKAVANRIPTWLAGRRERGMVDSMERVHVIYGTMEEMVDDGEAQRVMLLAAHNSGGLPRLGSPFYVSCIHSVTSREQEVPHYKNISVDSAYIEMLLLMMREGWTHFRTSENKQTLLSKFYQSEGIKDSVLVFLGVEDNQILFMSFAAYDRVFAEDEKTRLILRGYEIKEALFGP